MNEDKFETLELAIKEQSEELAKLSQQIQDLISIENILKNEVDSFSKKLAAQKITVETDTMPIQNIIDKAFVKVNFIIESQLYKKQPNNLQVFFQSDAKKWAVILVVAITFLTYLYWFSIR